MRQVKRFAGMFLVMTVVLVFSGCAVGKRAPLLAADDMARMGQDPRASCLVLGGFQGIAAFGVHDTINVQIETANGPMAASVKKKGFTELIVPFVYTAVPKGDFKVTWASFDLWTGKTEGPLNSYKMEKTTFGEPGVNREKSHQMGGHSKEIPAELSGKCDGGFIWLGVWKMKHGGIFSSSMLKRSSKSFEEDQRPRYVESVKDQMKGTAWEAELK